MTIVLNGTTGITNDGGYTGDGIVFADTTPANTLVTTTGGNVGIGTSSPNSAGVDKALTLNGSGNSILELNYGGTRGGYLFSNASNTVLSSVQNLPLIFNTGDVQRMIIDSSGNVSITQTPGKYSIDTSPGATTVANGGTVDFPNASGMLVVNNHISGNVTIWLCGSGVSAAIGSVGGTVGTLAYVSGISGYRWTNNSGASAVFGFFFVRTRTAG
jgi:hypothetical protein